MTEGSGPAPEAWVGEEVTIVTESVAVGEVETFSGKLMEVSDRGIVLEIEYDPEDIEEELTHLREAALREAAAGGTLISPSFFPWSSVKMISQMPYSRCR